MTPKKPPTQEKTSGARKADPTRNARQDRWYASMNVKAQTAAAHRDGFVSRSEALRLWGEGKATMRRLKQYDFRPKFCPVCGRNVTVKRDGMLIVHGYGIRMGGKKCAGSGQPFAVRVDEKQKED